VRDDFKKLKSYFARFPEIKIAYLFGSYAAGKNNKMSDLDIAVLLEEESSLADLKINIMAGLIELGYDNADLSILNNMSIVGKYEAVKHNKILYKDKDFDSGSYFSLVVRKYLDFKPYLEVQREYLKERVLNG